MKIDHSTLRCDSHLKLGSLLFPNSDLLNERARRNLQKSEGRRRRGDVRQRWGVWKSLATA